MIPDKEKRSDAGTSDRGHNKTNGRDRLLHYSIFRDFNNTTPGQKSLHRMIAICGRLGLRVLRADLRAILEKRLELADQLGMDSLGDLLDERISRGED